MLEGFEKTIRKIEEQKDIGHGGEKIVYPHPEKPDKVVGVYRKDTELEFEKSPKYMRAKFYLTKIMYMLFPKNIPDVSMTTTSPRTIERTKIVIDSSGHPKYRSEVKNFSKIIRELGVYIDDSSMNFVCDSQGNFVYIDDFYPWSPRSENESFIKHYSADKLRNYISGHLDTDECKKALLYLDRLEDLAKEMSASNYDKND